MEPNAPPTAMSRYFCKAISSFNIILDLGIAPEDNSATGFPVRSHHLSSYWEGTAVKGELLHHNQHSKNIILRPMEFRWRGKWSFGNCWISAIDVRKSQSPLAD